jgi:hypothetical protein
MASNSSFYQGSTNYGTYLHTATNPLLKTNASFYPQGFDYWNIPVELEAALTGAITIAGDLNRVTNLDAAISGTISITGDIAPVTNLSAALSGTISITGDVLTPITVLISSSISGTISVAGDLTAAAAAWDYDAEYLLHF